MGRHLEITQATGTRIYFRDAASPWQRGSNENANGLLRQYFPKSTNLAVHTRRDLERVEIELNRRPRIILGDRTPADLFAALLTSQNPPPVAMTAGIQAVALASFSTVADNVLRTFVFRCVYREPGGSSAPIVSGWPPSSRSD